MGKRKVDVLGFGKRKVDVLGFDVLGFSSLLQAVKRITSRLSMVIVPFLLKALFLLLDKYGASIYVLGFFLDVLGFFWVSWLGFCLLGFCLCYIGVEVHNYIETQQIIEFLSIGIKDTFATTKKR